MAPVFVGNLPHNVSKDAKYSVVERSGGYEIRLIYRLSAGEKALVTTAKHPALVKMVNEVKEEYVGTRGGAFYINEFGQVLVPASSQYYCAGTYRRYLQFEFGDAVIGPEAPSHLKPGDPWPGPKVGIPYVLTADGRDIKYKYYPRPQVEAERRLSQVDTPLGASRLARRLGAFRSGGGRIYINEALEFFQSVEEDRSWQCIYLGSLGEDPWFPPTMS
jgi:hypothetical protein